jgi:2-keto-4-pentenoate hydratase/2-oxohepta-3-ene-1,7-dioic acid hydratase in catechol pathway
MQSSTEVAGATVICAAAGARDTLISRLIAFVSRHATLKPGDVIATGTPEGVLLGEKEPQWLKAGDEVSVEIDGLRRLTNRFIAR